MKKQRAAAVLAAGLLTTVALYAFGRHGATGGDTIRVSGNIEVTDVDVSFRMAGRVIERPAAEGMPIAAGAVVATLDTTELRHEVAVHEAELEAAQAQLAELESGSRNEEIGQAQAAVRLAQSEAERWRAEETRQRELYGKSVISKRELEVAEASFTVARERLVQSNKALALLEEGPRREVIEAARARVRQAAEALAAIRTRLADATLVSPLRGIVIAEHVESGEQVAAGMPIVTIGDLDRVWMRAYVDETDLGRIRLGERVAVHTDTFSGKSYAGVITFISDQAEFTPKSVQTEKERVKLVYRIKIEIPNPSHELKPGMPADAEISALPRKQ